MNLPKWMFILYALAFISNYSKGGFIAKKKKRKEKEVQSIMELEFEKKKTIIWHIIIGVLW